MTEWGIFGLIAAVFAADLLAPLGMVVWILYFVPVAWAASLQWRQHLPLKVALVCSVLMLLGFWGSPPGVTPIVSLSMRLPGICVLWLTAFLGYQRAKQEVAWAENWKTIPLLKDVATTSVQRGQLQAALEKIVDTALLLTEADMGSVQLLDPATGQWVIRAHRGFPSAWLDFWAKVGKGSEFGPPALDLGERIIIEDLTLTPLFTLAAPFDAGVRAIVSTPLRGSHGRLIGACSVHFNRPHHPEESVLRRLDLLVCLAVEVIELARTQEALGEREAQLSALSDHLPGGLVYQIDTGENGEQRRFSYLSAAVEKMHGVTVEEALNDARLIFEQVCEEDRPLLAERESYARAQMKPFHAEVRVQLPAGAIRWRSFSAAPRRLSNHRLVWDGIEIDTTERKQAEEALRLDGQIMRSMADGVLLIRESDATILHTNPQLDRMFGYGPGELIGKHISTLSEPSSREPSLMAEEIAQVLWEKDLWDGEVRHVRKDGSVFWCHASVTPITHPRHGVTWIIVQQDISARKRAEEELRRLNVELDRRVGERTARLQGAVELLSHEISARQRTEEALSQVSLRLLRAENVERRRIARELHDSTGQKLAALTMYLETLKPALARSKAKSAETLDRVFALVEQAAGEIRTLSYLLHPPMLEEAGLVSAIRNYLNGFAERSGIQTTCELPETLEQLPDEVNVTLFRILQEALGNAHRHAHCPSVGVHLSVVDGAITMRVSDSGHGMPAETLESLRQGNGCMGVGIASMRDRLQQLGGCLEIHSDTAGTTICATIPIASKSS